MVERWETDGGAVGPDDTQEYDVTREWEVSVHPVCEHCWASLTTAPPAWPIRIQDRRLEACCYCGQKQRSGIYIRRPRSVMRRCPGHR